MSLFAERLERHAAMTEQALDSLLPKADGNDRLLRESMRYSVLGGGKRLRAHLVLEFCRACGGTAKDALPYAAAIETLHAFSLIHDDLPAMDNDTLRRGKPTNHIVFGEPTALLAGDALSLLALEICAGAPLSAEQNAAAVYCLASRAGVNGMCGGQQMDLQSENKQIGEDVLTELVNKKTGALFSAACELGCIAAGKQAEYAEAARNFGLQSGLAFQIADDLLDVHAGAEKLGKTPGKDAKSGKSTFLSLKGEESARALAASLCETAKACLQSFPRSAATESLAEYCDFILARDH